MTVLELIETLKNLGEENYNREIVIFDGPSCFTPTRLEILKKDTWFKLKDKVLID